MSSTIRGTSLTGTDDALNCFLSYVYPVSQKKFIDLTDADDRVLGSAAIAPIDYPHYDQCIMDGYAVRADDTRGCSNEGGMFMQLSGNGPVAAGTCQLVHTGSALPGGADAVVMREYAEDAPGGIILKKEAKSGEWIWPAGAGIGKGHVIFPENLQLKPTDIAMLYKMGVGRVEVYEKPRVLIIPTGDEVVSTGSLLSPGTVYESNGPMCQMLIRRYGGTAILADIVPDNVDRLKEALIDAASYDLIVTIGGSSRGKRDLISQAASSVGKVLVHEIAFHPGNHSGAGYVESGGKKTPLVFLPGYTESCAVAMFTLVRPAVKKLGHLPPSHYGRYESTLTQDIVKSPRIRKVIKVRVKDGKATPVRLIGESCATGEYSYLIIPENVEGFHAGDKVECICLE
jgi:molybdopterin molybdotransferase